MAMLKAAAGLTVAGTRLDDSDACFHEIEKHLTVPAAGRRDPAFQGRDRAAIAALEHPLARQILDAMKAARAAGHAYGDSADLAADIALRLAAIAAMTNFNTGAYDADYYNEDIDLKPAMGWLPSQGGGSPTEGAFWQLMTADIWYAAFYQKLGTVASQALDPVEYVSLPFRGECAGAFQLAIYYGLLNGLGAAELDRMAAKFGRMFVGPWRLSDTQPNPATLYMQMAPLSDPPIPGDYMYFKNKDDYSKLAPNGFWTGLNAFYVGMDDLGTRHYSGLGGSWLSEANLRMTVVNAYYHDCYPHTIADPLTECRFSERALLTIPPDLEPAMTEDETPKADHAKPPRPDPAALTAAGFARTADDRYELATAPLGAVAKALGFDPGTLTQLPSTGMANPDHRLALEGATLILRYADPAAGRRDPAATVSATLTLHG